MTDVSTIIVTGGSKQSINNLINSISDQEIEKIIKTFENKEKNELVEVYLYHGVVQVDEVHRLELFGAQKTSQLNYVDSLENQEFKGLILLLDANRALELEQLHQNIEQHQKYYDDFAMVIGVTHVNEKNGFTAKDVNKILESNNCVMPVYEVDPTSQAEVALLVESLIYFNNPQLAKEKQE